MIEVRDGQLGKGVYATRTIEPGCCILQGSGRRVSRRSRHSLQVDHDRHIVITGPIELINHSCDPNCGVLVRRGLDSLEIHALRTIEPGEELFTDYASFESEILHMPDPCLCGSDSCRGRIVGYWISRTIAERRSACTSPNIFARSKHWSSKRPER